MVTSLMPISRSAAQLVNKYAALEVRKVESSDPVARDGRYKMQCNAAAVRTDLCTPASAVRTAIEKDTGLQ